MQMCTRRGYAIQELALEQSEAAADSEVRAIGLQLSGRRGVESPVVSIGDIKAVVSASLAAAPHAKD